MAKAHLELTIPVPPLAAFNMLGAALKAAGAPPFRQEGWTLMGQEGVSLFKMGYPATVTGTVGDDGRGGSRITLDGENMGYMLNKVHLEGVLRKVAESIQQQATAMPPMPMAPPIAGVTSTVGGQGIAAVPPASPAPPVAPIAPEALIAPGAPGAPAPGAEEDAKLPPRVG